MTLHYPPIREHRYSSSNNGPDTRAMYCIYITCHAKIIVSLNEFRFSLLNYFYCLLLVSRMCVTYRSVCKLAHATSPVNRPCAGPRNVCIPYSDHFNIYHVSIDENCIYNVISLLFLNYNK